MNNNFTPEEKLRIIDLLAVTQSKEEFLDAVNKLLSEEKKKHCLHKKRVYHYLKIPKH